MLDGRWTGKRDGVPPLSVLLVQAWNAVWTWMWTRCVARCGRGSGTQQGGFDAASTAGRVAPGSKLCGVEAVQSRCVQDSPRWVGGWAVAVVVWGTLHADVDRTKSSEKRVA